MSLAEQVVNALKTDFDEVYQAGVEKGKAGSVDWLEYATCMYNLFRQTQFEENTELVINFGTKTNASYDALSFNQTFMRALGLKAVKIKTREKGFTLSAPNMFYSVTSIESIDFSDCEPMFSNIAGAFFVCKNLKSVFGKLDVKNCTSFANFVKGCGALEDIDFVEESIKADISFAQSPLLSDTSIQSIIDGLATVETQHTITFHADVKAKLTEEQKATISAKNWVLG